MNVCNGAFQTGPCKNPIRESNTQALDSSPIFCDSTIIRSLNLVSDWARPLNAANPNENTECIDGNV